MSTHSPKKKTWNFGSRFENQDQSPSGVWAGRRTTRLWALADAALKLRAGVFGLLADVTTPCSIRAADPPLLQYLFRLQVEVLFWHFNMSWFICTLSKLETHILKHLILTKGNNHLRTRQSNDKNESLLKMSAGIYHDPTRKKPLWPKLHYLKNVLTFGLLL